MCDALSAFMIGQWSIVLVATHVLINTIEVLYILSIVKLSLQDDISPSISSCLSSSNMSNYDSDGMYMFYIYNEP